MFKIFARCTGYHPFAPPDHSLYPKCRLIMNYVNKVPLPSTVQMGSANR